VEARGEVRENSRQEGWIDERRWCGRSRLVAAAGGGGAAGGRPAPSMRLPRELLYPCFVSIIAGRGKRTERRTELPVRQQAN